MLNLITKMTHAIISKFIGDIHWVIVDSKEPYNLCYDQVDNERGSLAYLSPLSASLNVPSFVVYW